MDAEAFWKVIGAYNQHTIVIQIFLFVFVMASVVLSYTNKVKNSAKIACGIANLFLCFGFFASYGTQAIQKYFAFPLYLICGILFLYEGFRNKDDKLHVPNRRQIVLIILYLLYPFISLGLGNQFPQMVTYIMPCPIMSLSIVVYAGYHRKNKLLLLLLTIWGLTGIKSIIFSAYEDMILLICGIYGAVLLAEEMKKA